MGCSGAPLFPPAPRWVERAREDAEADRQVQSILINAALTDMRAVRTAQMILNEPPVPILVPVPTLAEKNVLQELAVNLLSAERAAMFELLSNAITEHLDLSAEVHLDFVTRLRTYVNGVRGNVGRDVRDDLVLTAGHEDYDGVPLRPSRSHQYPELGQRR